MPREVRWPRTPAPSLSPLAQPSPPPAPIGVSGRSESPALPRKEEPVLAGFELTPTAPLDEEHASRATLPLHVDAAARRPRRGITAAFVGIGIVRDVVVVNRADFCTLSWTRAPRSARRGRWSGRGRTGPSSTEGRRSANRDPGAVTGLQSQAGGGLAVDSCDTLSRRAGRTTTTSATAGARRVASSGSLSGPRCTAAGGVQRFPRSRRPPCRCCSDPAGEAPARIGLFRA